MILNRPIAVDAEERGEPYVLSTETVIRRLGNETKLMIAGSPIQKSDPFMVKAIIRAHRWFEMLKNHKVKSVAEIAKLERLPRTYVSSLLPLAFLAPNLTEAILDGCQPADLRLDELLKQAQMNIRWAQ